jgi:hypothetical protein
MSLRAETRTKRLAGSINISLLRSESQVVDRGVRYRAASHFFPFRIDIFVGEGYAIIL